MNALCAQCGKEYQRSNYRNASEFCSASCRNRNRSGSPFGPPRRQQPAQYRPCSKCGRDMRAGKRMASAPQCMPCRRAAADPLICPDCGGERSTGAVLCRPCRGKRLRVRADDDHRVRYGQRSGAAPGISYKDRKRLLDKWKRRGATCTYCPSLADTIDHTIPLVRGGTNYEGNLAPCCRSCNSRKGGRLNIEARTGRAAQRMTTAPMWKPRVKTTPKIKAIKGEQAALNACPECGALCVNTYCNIRCSSRYSARTAYRRKVGIPIDAPLYSRSTA